MSKNIKYIAIWLMLMLATVANAQRGAFPERPSNTRFVEDYAKVIDNGALQQLETLLVAYNDTSSTQIAVVTVDTLHGYDIAQYAAELGEKWGIGDKKKDNGILILIAPKQRRMTIATGYGTEHRITDIFARMLIENDAKPNFRNGNYGAGIQLVVQHIQEQLSGEYKAEPKANEGIGSGQLLLFIILFIALMLFISYKNRGKNNFGGNDWTGGGTWTGGGYTGGTFTNWNTGGGGGDGGGLFGGGRSFGGGSFGGGGASGEW
jgi:uncharacterized protein